jgi:hypothetical protein
MMQTNEPVRNYARYVVASTNKYLRPQSAGEATDSAVSIYREYFSRLISVCLIPTVYIACFLIVFFQLLFPRLFETQYSEDTTLQIIEFVVLLGVGLTAGVAIAAIGLAKLVTYANTVVRACFADEELTTSEVVRRSAESFGRAYKTTFIAFWYLGGLLTLSVVPIVFAGFLLKVTSEENAFPAFISFFTFVTIPVGIGLFLARLGVGLCVVNTSIAENLHGKEALKRTKYLFHRNTPPSTDGNVAQRGAVACGMVYLFLRLGYVLLDNQTGFKAMIVNWMPTSIVKVTVDIALGILPEFLAVLFTAPYIAIAASYAYYQRRIGVEGLDIETLYENLPASRR